jgi:hypothetical protein
VRTISRAQIGLVPVHSYVNPFLNVDETEIVVGLVNSVAARVMIEFGCNVGRTARNVLDNVASIERYIGVDVPWQHKPTLAQQRHEVPSLPGLWCREDSRFVLELRERGSLGLRPEDLIPCDALFIDGDHSKRAVLHDSALARSLVKPGGVIMWHDYGNPAVEVTPTLDRLSDFGWPIEHVEHSWIAFCRIDV